MKNERPNPLLDTYNLQQKAFSNITKVAILGAESTGKTTLCKDMAAHFETQWVGEYMRPYAQEKWDNEKKAIAWQDLMPIAQGQIAWENKQAARANRYLFCDTSLFEIMVYAHLYYNRCPLAIEAAALQHHYDLILLTEVDVPWEADDLRDRPNDREAIRDTFANTLTKYKKPFLRIGEDRQARVRQVAKWLENLPCV